MRTYRSEKAKDMILATYDELLGQWGIDVDEMDLVGGYGSTHVIAAGQRTAEPLVMFHGVGDDSALMWLHNAKALAEKFRVYAVDTLGGPGKSVPGPRYAEGFDGAQWIDSILDDLGITKTNMAGVSHGAYLAQYYAAARPERVKKTVCLAGTVPVGNGSPMKTMMRIFLPEALFPTERNTAKLIRKLTGARCDVFLSNPLVMTHYRWLLKGFNNMAMRFHRVAPLSDAQIDSIRANTLYLVGEDDPFQRLGGKEALMRYGMQCRFFERVGHGINHEIADEVNRILVGYL